jgi:hypothetical protein
MAPKKVSSDIAYQEMYQEMRRYRDYELSVSTWYMTFLLAILGGIFTAKFGELGFDNLANNCVVQTIVVFVVLLIGSSGMWSVYYSHRRYKHIRDYIFDKKLNLEPDWKKNYSPERIFPEPRHLILSTQLILIVLSIVAAFWPM